MALVFSIVSIMDDGVGVSAVAIEELVVIQINLLPWRALYRDNQQWQFKRALSVSFLLMGVMVLMAHYYVTAQCDTQQQINQRLTALIHQYRARAKTIQHLLAVRARYIQKMDRFQALQTERNAMAQYVVSQSRLLPQSVYLTHLERAGNKVILKGITTSTNAIAQLLRRMENAHLFQNIVLHEIKQVNDTTENRASTFTISFFFMLRKIEG